MRPGPLRIALENRTDSRVLPTVFIAGDDPLHDLMKRRRPFLTAKRLLSTRPSATSTGPTRSTSTSG